MATLEHAREVVVIQRKELAELFGFETRNKYAIEADGVPLGFAAERGKSALDFLARLFLGHWRSFEIHIFDAARRLALRAVHPFRFFFQRLEVEDASGQHLGAIEQRFAWFSKRFDLEDAQGRVLLRVDSSIFNPWTFVFEQQGREVARIEKKWSGLLREAFTDADTFRVSFLAPELLPPERSLILTAALFVDLQYFERKAH
jgi:uncharacterized protein YxjI